MSNQPDKFLHRVARPQTLAGAMGGLMRHFGFRASDADLVARWPKIMGADIAAIAQIAAIKKMRDGRYNIAIRPLNPAFTLQLSYMTDEITKKLNNYFGRAAIGKISFRK